ncbi:MAG: alpha-glucosidase [Lachnospiraceae bacterium]|nr:alpha-glucosidase [Lachnospiraceae bacterium]
MITVKTLEQMKVNVGIGTNDFTMSRGSFVYKKDYTYTSTLNFVDKSEEGNTTKLHFNDPDKGDDYYFNITEEDGDIEVTCEGGNPDINRYWVSFAANSEEHIYGCGETYSKFDLKGETVRIWVAEHQNTNRIGKKLIRELFGKKPKKVVPFKQFESYYAQPTYVSSDKFFVHVFTDDYAEFDFSNPNQTRLYMQCVPHFVVKKADSFKELSSKVSDLLGHQRQLPDWVYDGAILAVQEGPEAIDRKIAKAEAKGVKIVGIWSQDWCGCRRTKFGYQVMWNWRYDKEDQYSNLPEKIKEWNAKGIRFLGYINPFIALEKDIYQEAKEKGYCVKDKDGNDYQVTITTFPAAMVDFTNPEAYEWYKGLIKNNMIGIGLSGWMADFGEYLPVDCVLHSGEDPYELHNRWPAIWAKLNSEAITEAGKDGEVFFFTRAGHTETIKYSHLMWNGDQHVDWSLDDGIAAVIPATLSLAMSGYGMAHSDVGGYTTMKSRLSREKELLLRWEEMNAFSPLYRFHEGNQPIMNVQFDDDDELLTQLEKFTSTHVRLREYLKDLVDENVKNGTPVMRPLFYHYDEPKAYTESLEYLLGEDMLVAPVIDKGATTKNVYLPKDKWVHLYSGKEFDGGMVTVDAPIGQPPVFVRKDSNRFDELMAVAGK